MALQMTWQPRLLLRKSGPPLGLKNLGNTCYLNSVLQCLTYTPPLANFCLRNQHSSLCGSSSECPFCILERRIVRSLNINATLDAPSKIHNSLRIFAKHFRCGHQEDAHEFLRYVIDACHNTCVKERKLRNGSAANGMESHYLYDTVVKEIFGGALQSEVKCMSCGAESRKTDEIMDISLDLFQSCSLKDALRRFFQSEVLDGSNKYSCEKCKKISAARKQMSVLRAPNILVIQLKRFEGIFGLKIDRAIAFEEGLMLSSYMSKANQDPQPEYNLFGTIVHSGYSPESGHYYAYIKDATGRWYRCNDSYVTVSTLQEVLSEKVYILFFSRTNQRPRPAKTGFPHDGTKSTPVCNGNAVSVNQKETVPLKAPPTKPNGAYQSEKDTLITSKIDKVPPNLGIKFNLKRQGSKRLGANGNGNLTVHDNTSLAKHGDLEEPAGIEKIKMSSISKSTEELELTGKLQMQSVSNGNCFDGCEPFDVADGETKFTGKQQMQSISNGNFSNGHKSFDVVDRERKQTLLLAGNGEIQNICADSPKIEVHEENGTGNAAMCRESDSDLVSHNGNDGCSSDITGYKRKSLDTEKAEATPPMEPSNLSAVGASSVAELAKFKEMLSREATSDLHLCGWVDEVQSFMHARKRSCTQSTGSAPNTTELKKLLIADAKKAFTSQLPESLKEHLIGRLRSFSQGKMLLDT